MSVKLTVHTYNILSSHLSNPSWYKNCNPENCIPENRFIKILEKIKKSIDECAIIGLQEVSRDWIGKLYVFFEERGYHMIDSLYGYPKNGYMGILIAYPRNKFILEDCKIFRVSDNIYSLPKNEIININPIEKYINNLISCFNPIKNLLFKQESIEKEVDIWGLATSRYNTSIFCRFKMKENNSIFCVSNYHMPCIYQHQEVMIIHASEYINQSLKYANDDPLITMGDYNILPDSSPYKLIIQGFLNENDENYPPKKGNWKPDLIKPMKSAYVEVHGNEPIFTNHNGKSVPFTGTLDYIFYTGNLKPISTIDIPELDDIDLMPNEIEPSDHILIGADFQLI